MSLVAAIPLGVGSSVVYGTSIVVQHRAAHTGGTEDAKHLLGLLRNPRWLLAIGGDFVGFLLQIGALAAGPVVLIQPLVVLMLPVALVAAYLMGGPRPRPGDYLGCVAVIGGLTGFLSMVGRPRHAGRHHYADPHPVNTSIAIVLVLVVGTSMCLAVRGRNAHLRGAIYGAAAGASFGTLGVLVNSVSHHIVDRQASTLVTHPAGLVSIVGIALMGTAGIILTQVSFQVGALGATLPASLAADPTAAVILGVLLLHQLIPTGAGYLIGYLLCLAAVIAGAARLASPATAPAPVSAGV